MRRFERELRWTHSYLADRGWRVFEGEDPPKDWYFGDGEVQVYLEAIVGTAVRLGYCAGNPVFRLVLPRAHWVLNRVALMMVGEAGIDDSAAYVGPHLRNEVWWSGAPTIDAESVAGALDLDAPEGVYGVDHVRRFLAYPGWSVPVFLGRRGMAPVIRVKPKGRRALIGPILDDFTTMARHVSSSVRTPSDYLAVMRESASRASAGASPGVVAFGSLNRAFRCDLATSFLLGDLDDWRKNVPVWEAAAAALGLTLDSSICFPIAVDFGDKLHDRLQGLLTFENVAARMQRILDEEGVESLGRPPEVLV